MYEKLTRMLYKQAEFMMGKVTERMQVIDAVAQPFYEKINKLSSRGPVSENQLWEQLNSIKGSEKLSEEEKTLLVGIFGQIAGVHKSKVVNAVVVEKPSRTKNKNKNVALTGKTNIKSAPA